MPKVLLSHFWRNISFIFSMFYHDGRADVVIASVQVTDPE